MKNYFLGLFKSIFQKLIYNPVKALERENRINIFDSGGIDKKAYLEQATVQGKVVIGRSASVIKSHLKGNIIVGENSKLSNVYLAGTIEIGKYTSVWGPNTDIYSRLNKVCIGNFCSIARNVSIQEFNHKTDRLTNYFIFQNFFKEDISQDINSKGSVLIGNDVWIGAHSVILSGAEIGDGAIIGANSVVTGKIPAFAIAGGIPAKVIKYRFSPEIMEELTKMEWWNWPAERLKRNREIFEDGLTLEKLQRCAL